MSNTDRLRLVSGGRVDRLEAVEHYFTPLGDDEATRALIENGSSRRIVEQIIQRWRVLGTELEYANAVAWDVRAGFDLKHHAPRAGPCHQDFDYLQDWQLEGSEPTPRAVVFFVPRLIHGSIGQSVYWQQKTLERVREDFKLPTHHLSGFGSADMLAGLILAHFAETGERVPFDQCLVRTDTSRLGGWRLSLGYFTEKYGLDCQDWPWDPHRDPNLGCFPVGMEIIGSNEVTPPRS